MDFKLQITVHIIAEERTVDEVLVPHSKNYGINGKEIIAPLRKVNGREYVVRNVSPSFSVHELWGYIDEMIYGNVFDDAHDCVLDFVREHHITQKYIFFDGLRYRIDDTDKPLLYYLSRMNQPETDAVQVQILVSANAGDVARGDGIRYYMWSKEGGSHNEPHVHVDIRHEISASFSLIDGRQLAYDGKIKSKDYKSIQKMIEKNKVEWLKHWNEHTDGLTADLNQAGGLISY